LPNPDPLIAPKPMLAGSLAHLRTAHRDGRRDFCLSLGRCEPFPARRRTRRGQRILLVLPKRPRWQPDLIATCANLQRAPQTLPSWGGSSRRTRGRSWPPGPRSARR